MADDSPIIIELDDKVDPSIQKKIDGIGDSATSAANSLKDLQQQIGSVDSSSLKQLQDATASISNSLKAQLDLLKQFQSLPGTGGSPLSAPKAPATLPTAPTRDFTDATYAAAQAENKLLSTIANSSNTFGKSRSEILAMRAATAGLTQEASPFISKLKQAENALKDLAAGSSHNTIEFVRLGREFAEGNMTRASGTLSVMAARSGLLAAALSPLGLIIAGLAAVTVGLIAAQLSYAGLQNQVNIAVTGAGRAMGVTRDEFQAMIETAATAGDITTRQATNLGTALARTGQVGAQNIASIIAKSKDLAATLGTDFDGVTQILVRTFSEPQKGLEALNAQLHFMDAATQAVVNNLFKQGNAQEAIAIAVNKLPDALAKANQNTTFLSRSWERLTTDISDGWTWLGKFMAEGESATLGQQIDAATLKVKNLKDALADPRSTAAQDTLNADLIKQQGILDKLTAQQRQLNDVTKSRADNANLGTQSGVIQKLIEAAAPAALELKAMEVALAALEKAAQDDKLKDLLPVIKGLSDAINNLKGATQSYVEQGTKARQLSALDVEAINATTAAERASIAEKRTRAELNGKLMDEGLRQAQIDTAGASILAQAAKARQDENLSLERNIALFGTVGPQRELALELLQRELAARSSGNAYSVTELANLRAKLQVQQQLSQVQDQLNSLFDQFIKPQQDYNNLLIAANQLYSNGRISADQYFLAVTQGAQKALLAQNTMTSGIQAGLLQVAGSAANVSQIMSTGVVDAVNAGQSAFVSFAQTGKFSMQQLANDVVGSLAKIVYQLVIVRSLMAALGWIGIPGLTSTSGVSSVTTAGPVDPSPLLSSTVSPVALSNLHVQAPIVTASSSARSNAGPLVEVHVENQHPNAKVNHQVSKGVDGREIHRMVIASVNEGFAAGQFDAAQGSRFGNVVPQKVKG